MTNAVRVLIVEDDENVASTVRDNLEESVSDVKVAIETDLTKAVERIKEFEPDAVVLDLIAGPVNSGDMAGNIGWQEIWNHRFVPLIVYTASAQETDPPLPQNHPFVVRIAKGRANSVNDVVHSFQSYLPFIGMVQTLSASVSSQLQLALKDAAPLLWSSEIDDAQRAEMFPRVLLRRVAALADRPVAEPERRLIHWEQFIVPPIAPDLMTGDVLKRVNEDWESCASYRIVMSPSCDLVRNAGGQPKSPNVLVARCQELGSVWDKWSLNALTSASSEAKAKDKLHTLLTDSHPKAGLILLPGLSNVLPHMAANLKDLELVAYSSVAGFGEASNEEYERIASVDSPFREALVWAYVQVACRPGLPDRQLDKWVDEIIASMKSQEGSSNGDRQ